MTDLNKIAKEVTKAEGLKHSLNIGDVKEVMKIIFTTYSMWEIIKIKMKYKGVGK
jgi:hypothetical protein